MNRILELLQDLRPDADFLSSGDFVKEVLLDSFDIMTLVAQLENEYTISISIENVVPENFKSIEAIVNLVRKSGGNV
jgi:acyl carrier protein